MKEVIDTVSVALANGDTENVGNVVMQEVNRTLLSAGVDEVWADKIDNLIVLLFIIGIALLANIICRKIILRVVAKLVKQTKATWDDIVFNHKVMVNVSRMVAPILIYIAIPIAFPEHADSDLLDFLRRLCLIYIIAVFLRFISALFTAVYQVYSEREQYRDKPLKGLLQTAQVILFFIGAIIIISILINQSPMVLLTGLGASAAILMLVFKDTIMGLVAGVQLSANDMLRPGDWITMPKYGADGTVIEVTLTTVKVRNWDNTITTVPPYALVSDSFQNWRGMRESGGRRVKRSINIDMNTVRFCTPEQMKKFEKQVWMSGFEKTGKEEVNLYVFRHYLEYYLRHNPRVNTELILMVRQLQPTPQGLPIELYFFSANKDWIPYERLQAEVFDHLLAVLPEFGLRVFQIPSGLDVLSLSSH